MAKNLIPYPYYETTKTQDGLTFTDNGDRTITINGTATDTVNFYLMRANIDNAKLFKLNTWYTVSGTPTGGSTSTYYMFWDTQCTDTGSGKTILWDGSTNSVVIQVKAGTVCDNIVFNPSIVQTYPDSYEDNRFKSLPSYHYEDNTSGHIVNSATDKLRNYTITGNGKNLFNQEKILSQQGWSKLEDGSWYYYKTSNGDLRNKVLWKNTEGYTGRIKVLYNFKYGRPSSDYSGSGHGGALILFKYTDGTTYNIWLNTNTFSANTWYAPNNAYITSNSSKTVDSVIWSYGDFSNPTWVKDIIITKDASVSKYEPYNGVGDKTKNLLNPDEFELDYEYNRARNLIPYPYSWKTHSENGITFTDVGDGTIIASGILTSAYADYFLSDNTSSTVTLPSYSDSYILSGAPVSSIGMLYYQAYEDGTWKGDVTDTGYSVWITPSENATKSRVWIRIYGGEGTVCDNLVFKPQIEKLVNTENLIPSLTSDTAMTLPEFPSEYSFSGMVRKNVMLPAGQYLLSWSSSTKGGASDPVFRLYENNRVVSLTAASGNTAITLSKAEHIIYIYSNGYDASGSTDVTSTVNDLTLTTNGVTFTVNSDGTITANGTATTNASFMITNNKIALDDAPYIFTGCPQGGSSTTYKMEILFYKGTTLTSVFSDYGTGRHINSLYTSKNDSASMIIRIYAGTTVDNLVFNPRMERHENIFESYIPGITNNSGKLILNNSFSEDHSIVLANLINRTKNFIPYPFTYHSIYGVKNGITVTDSGNSSITLSGTATASVVVYLTGAKSYRLPAGKYYLSGNSSNVSTLFLSVRANATDGSTLLYTSDHGEGAVFDITEIAKQDNYQGVTIAIRISKGTVLDNVALTPQLKSVHNFSTFTNTKYLFGVDTENTDCVSHKFSLMKNGVVSETITSNVLDMTNRTDIDNIKAELIINKNIEFNNIEVKPFLLSSEDTNNLLPQTYAVNNHNEATQDDTAANDISYRDDSDINIEIYDDTRIKNGITYTINDDKSITLNGTATEDFYFNINTIDDGENLLGNVGTLTLTQTNGYDAVKDYGCSTELNNKFLALQGQKLIFDFDISYEKGLFQGELYISYKKTDNSTGWFGTYRVNDSVFTVPNDIQSVTNVSVRIRSNWSSKTNHANDNIPVTLSNISLKVYDEDVFHLVPIKPFKYYLTGCPEGGSSDTYYLERQLYEDVNNQNKERYIYGKNLLPYPYFQSLPTTHMGITYTDNGDGGVAWSGTKTGQSAYTFVQGIKLDKTKTYTVSGARDIYFKFLNKNTYVTSVHDYTHDYCTVDLAALTFEWDRVDICIYLSTADSSVIYPMLVEGDKPAEFEVYTKTLDVAKETGKGLLVDTTDMSNTMFGLRAVVKKGTTVTNLTFNPKLTYYDYEPYNKYKISIARVKNLMFEDGLTEYGGMLKTNAKYKANVYPAVYNMTYELQRYLKRNLKPNVTYILDKDFEGYEKNSEGMICLYKSSTIMAKAEPYNGYKSAKFAFTQEEIGCLSYVYIYGIKETAGLYKYIRLYDPNNPIEETIIYMDEPLVQDKVLDKITDGTDDIYLTKNKTSAISMQDNLIDFTLTAGSSNWVYNNIGYYVSDVNKVDGTVLWTNDDNYTGQIKILYKVKYAKSSTDATGVGEYIKVIYTDGTSSAIKLTGDYDADTWYNVSDVTTENKTVKWLEWAYEDATNLAYVDDIMVTYDLTATEYKPCVKIYSEEEKNDNQLVVLTDVHPSSEVYQYYTY